MPIFFHSKYHVQLSTFEGVIFLYNFTWYESDIFKLFGSFQVTNYFIKQEMIN